jgi:cysteine desulfuration protein SufE
MARPTNTLNVVPATWMAQKYSPRQYRFRPPAILYMGNGIERGTRMTIDEIRDNFALLEDWDDRYRYVIELGRTLAPMPEAEHSPENKVQGCVSQVWLAKHTGRNDKNQPLLNYLGDSDAHIVRGLVAILLTLYSGHTPQQILATDALAVFDEFGFREHLTPQRSNGLRAMVERIRADARQALAAA